VLGQVEKGGNPAGGAGELGRPAGQVGQVAAVGGQAGLQVTLEGQEQLVGWGLRVSMVGSSLAGRVRLAARAWSSRV
jgi:hypothetical protein